MGCHRRDELRDLPVEIHAVHSVDPLLRQHGRGWVERDECISVVVRDRKLLGREIPDSSKTKDAVNTSGTPRGAFPVVVIGASAGGLDAVRRIAEALPSDYHAAFGVVFHVGRGTNIVPEILNWHGKQPAVLARHGDAFTPGRIYIAPSDCHMVLSPPGCIELDRGAPVHNTRPAVDPLFLSAAKLYGERVVGVVLSGYGTDGAVGLRAIKRYGGVALVQDPAEAPAPQMPAAARAAAEPEVLPLDGLAALVAQFCSP
jgi:two-component system chemotaxis response regulator CheB